MFPWLPLAALIATPLLAQDDLETASVAAPFQDAQLQQLEVQAEQAQAEAIAEFQRFIEQHPDAEQTTTARFRLAGLLMEQAETSGAYGPAIEQLQRVLKDVELGESGSFEQHVEAWYMLGWCARLQEPTRAHQAWLRVTEIAPGTELAASALLHLGSQAMDQADWEQAASYFEAIGETQADPATAAQAAFLAGWTYYKTDAWSSAFDAFSTVLTQDSPSAPRDEALEYMVLVLVERCEAEGTRMAVQLDTALARVPPALQQAFLDRTIVVLEGMARFDQAEAVRRRGATDAPMRKRVRTKRKDRG